MILFGIYIILSVLLIYSSQEEALKRNIKIVSFGFALLAFFQTVDSQSDLMVAFSHLDNIRSSGWGYFGSIANRSSYFTGKPALQLYFYILSLLPVNNLYSSISMLIAYLCVLKASLYASDFYGASLKQKKMLLIFCILALDFFDASNGVRNVLSFAVFIYCLVNELLLKKNKILCWVGYTAAALFHPAALVLVMLRILLIIKKRWLKIVLGVLTLMWSNGLQGVYQFLSLFGGIPFIGTLVHKLDAYTLINDVESSNFNETAFNNSSSYMMMRNFRLLLAVGILLLVILIIWKRRENITKMMTYCMYIALFMLGATASGLASNIVVRYSFALIMLTPVFYAEYLQIDIPKKWVSCGPFCYQLANVFLTLCVVLFNYYMFKYHYVSLSFGFTLY